MNLSQPTLKMVLQIVNEHNSGNNNNYILCKQDTDEAIRKLDDNLRYSEYLDAGSILDWFYNEFKMHQADSNSLYRPFIALENDNIIQLRISRHYNTRDAVKNTYPKGTITKPSFEYHVIIERINIIYSNANKQVIRRNTCIRQVPIYVTEMSFEDFSDGDKRGKFIDKLIYILTKGVVPSVKESKQNNKTKNKIEENMRNKQVVRLNESQLIQIVRESVKNILCEHMSDLNQPNGHNISPKEALAQFLRISPKAIYQNRYETYRYYCGQSPKTDNQTSSWCVYSSYEDAEADVRSWAPSYCSHAADDDYWYNAGFEKTQNGDFNWDEIANCIIYKEGIEWFLSSYDGTCDDLPDGYIGFRCD